MKIECPECQGRGRYYRPKPIPMAPITNHDLGSTTEISVMYEKELVDCPRCNGAKRVERTERVDVMQGGRKIGTVPPSFDPAKIKSTSFFYEPRPGDFRLSGDVWVADRMLGPGDLEAVPGFVWDRSTSQPSQA